MQNDNIFETIKWSAENYAHNRLGLFYIKCVNELNNELLNTNDADDFSRGFRSGIRHSEILINRIYEKHKDTKAFERK